MLHGCIVIERSIEVVFGIGIESVVVFELEFGVEEKLELDAAVAESETACGLATGVFPFLPLQIVGHPPSSSLEQETQLCHPLAPSQNLDFASSKDFSSLLVGLERASALYSVSREKQTCWRSINGRQEAR